MFPLCQTQVYDDICCKNRAARVIVHGYVEFLTVGHANLMITIIVVVVSVLGLLCTFLIIGVLSGIFFHVHKILHRSESTNLCSRSRCGPFQEPGPIYEDINPRYINESKYTVVDKNSIELSNNKAYDKI